MTPTKTRKELRGALIGMVLGDGHLDRQRLRNGQPTGHFYLDIAHSERQRAYLEWKRDIVQDLFHYQVPVNDKRSAKFPAVRMRTRTHARLDFLGERLFVAGDKRITDWGLANLTDLGMAIWFMDDGHLRLRRSKGNEVSLGVYDYPKSDVEALRDWIEDRYGADFRLSQNVKYAGTDRGWYLRRGLSSARLMLDRLAEFAPKCMAHKFNYQFSRGPYKLA